jgi:hypothetical protein
MYEEGVGGLHTEQSGGGVLHISCGLIREQQGVHFGHIERHFGQLQQKREHRNQEESGQNND